MVTTVFTEPMRAGEHLVSEVTTQSREVGIVAQGATATYPPGTVMGKITASNKLTQLAPAATDGSQTPAAILYGRTDATLADTSATINVRLTEVNGLCLTWPTGITTAQQTAAIATLATMGVIVRT